MHPATQPVFVNDSWQTRRNARTLQAYMALRNREIGARLRELRGEKPQTTVAEELGVAERTYQNWEAGDAKPSYRNLQRLAEYFGVGEDFILTGEGETRVINGVRIGEVNADTPDLFRQHDTDVDLASVLAEFTEAIRKQNEALDTQTGVLEDIKTALGEIKQMLGKDTQTADRMEAVSTSLGGAAAQLDAAIQRVVTTPTPAPARKAPKKPATAPKRSRQA